MFKDIDISQDFIKSFKEQRHATALEKGLHVNVLSQSWWPTYPDKQVPPPHPLPPTSSLCLFPRGAPRFYLSYTFLPILMLGYSTGRHGQGIGKFQGVLVEEAERTEINVETCLGTLYSECQFSKCL